MNTKRGYIVPVLVVIIIVLVLAFIIYAYKKENNEVIVVNTQTPAVSATSTPATSTKPVVKPGTPVAPATPAPSATTTSAWKSYANTTKGYTVKYPSGFMLSNESPSCVALIKDGVGYIYIGAPGTYTCTGYAPNVKDVSSAKLVLANNKEFTAVGYRNMDWTASFLNFPVTGTVEVSYGVRAKEATKASTEQEYSARLKELEAVISTITVK